MCIDIDENIDRLAKKRLVNSGFGRFYHCAIIFTKKRGIVSPLVYGENMIRGKNSIHAEEDAVNRIPYKKDGKIQKVSLLVLRVTRSGDYTMSKPCLHCIKKMNTLINKNYKISNVYYTNNDGIFVKSSLNRLNSDPDKHISKWNRFHRPRLLDLLSLEESSSSDDSDS